MFGRALILSTLLLAASSVLADTLVETIPATSALDLSLGESGLGHDLSAQSCPSGTGLCGDGGCCPLGGQCCILHSCCKKGYYCITNSAHSRVACCPDGYACAAP
ncbi:hypothetical protein CONPUDRAFT_165994 [Coniophora puteana RWD-64-598 SS2]|uniref:Granulins domain-containing protein n=1 Tax=Coniophora puteana (strain RWD-64-598) TaxID=741705 RepID=A0A5M3MNZ2_CONPW|nr:uncharacterized protein CONPUDRAFT_165994 [Coniophora puteana RWD-64-598 SS2]EIW80484.1 hypothetical protein CONPUDRAFT_165994 [Coniophora puteana RWD-64-598 SS2]